MIPKCSRLVSGLVATAAWCGFLISPYVVENLTKNRTIYEWTIMHCMYAAVFCICWLVYLPIRFEAQNNVQAGQIDNGDQK